MRRGLYVGRFQIFHNCHLEVIKYIDSHDDIDEILIGIGSSQYSHLNKSPAESWSRNPFSFEERREMVERSLEGVIKKPYRIYPVPDLHNYTRWFESLRQILPEFMRMYTLNPEEQAYFQQRGYEAPAIPEIIGPSSTTIRDMLVRGEDISAYVPNGTLEVLMKIGGKSRINETYEKDLLDILSLRKQGLEVNQPSAR
jgi:nicotinamide-nucleotide adenylyltransferase